MKLKLSKEQFEEIQKMSRFELLLLFVRRGDYGRSFYLSSVVEILYGKGNFIDKVKTMSLYGILEHKIKKHDLQAVQLHGSESVEFCEILRLKLTGYVIELNLQNS